jgi:hypothetical protein
METPNFTDGAFSFVYVRTESQKGSFAECAVAKNKSKNRNGIKENLEIFYSRGKLPRACARQALYIAQKILCPFFCLKSNMLQELA